MIITLKDRTISSGYVIASLYKEMDMTNDPCTYISQSDDPSTWSNFENAKVFPNEASLAIALERCKKEQSSMNPQPMYWQTTLTTVDTDSLKEHTAQARRSEALAKLNNDDLAALGLMGPRE